MNELVFAVEPSLSCDEFIDILERSGLAARRPVSDRVTIEGMLRNAQLIVTTRLKGKLVGVSRAITDFHFCTYLSDLAVDESHQRRGIGRRLIEETHARAGKKTRLILLAAPAARDYYPHIGMVQHDSCWQIPPENGHNRAGVEAPTADSPIPPPRTRPPNCCADRSSLHLNSNPVVSSDENICCVCPQVGCYDRISSSKDELIPFRESLFEFSRYGRIQE